MAIHVKDRETDELVREFARHRGIGITEAIRTAVKESLAADKQAKQEPLNNLKRKLQPLFDEIAAYDLKDGRIDKAFFDRLWEEEDLL